MYVDVHKKPIYVNIYNKIPSNYYNLTLCVECRLLLVTDVRLY